MSIVSSLATKSNYSVLQCPSSLVKRKNHTRSIATIFHALISSLNNGSTARSASYLLQPLIPDLRLVIAHCAESLAY